MPLPTGLGEELAKVCLDYWNEHKEQENLQTMEEIVAFIIASYEEQK